MYAQNLLISNLLSDPSFVRTVRDLYRLELGGADLDSSDDELSVIDVESAPVDSKLDPINSELDPVSNEFAEENDLRIAANDARIEELFNDHSRENLIEIRHLLNECIELLTVNKNLSALDLAKVTSEIAQSKESISINERLVKAHKKAIRVHERILRRGVRNAHANEILDTIEFLEKSNLDMLLLNERTTLALGAFEDGEVKIQSKIEKFDIQLEHYSDILEDIFVLLGEKLAPKKKKQSASPDLKAQFAKQRKLGFPNGIQAPITSFTPEVCDDLVAEFVERCKEPALVTNLFGDDPVKMLNELLDEIHNFDYSNESSSNEQRSNESSSNEQRSNESSSNESSSNEQRSNESSSNESSSNESNESSSNEQRSNESNEQRSNESNEPAPRTEKQPPKKKSADAPKICKTKTRLSPRRFGFTVPNQNAPTFGFTVQNDPIFGWNDSDKPFPN